MKPSDSSDVNAIEPRFQNILNHNVSVISLPLYLPADVFASFNRPPSSLLPVLLKSLIAGIVVRARSP